MIIIVGLELLVSPYCFFFVFFISAKTQQILKTSCTYMYLFQRQSTTYDWKEWIAKSINNIYNRHCLSFYFSIKFFYNVKFDLLCRNIHLHSYIFRSLRSIHPKGNTICLSYLQYICRNLYTISVDISVVLFLF